jgi:hypothetical protein
MSYHYLVASLPMLFFGDQPPFSSRELQSRCVGVLKTEHLAILKAEVIRIRGQHRRGAGVRGHLRAAGGRPVEFSGELLSVELGPGLLTSIYDGLQNPLPSWPSRAASSCSAASTCRRWTATARWAFTPGGPSRATCRRRHAGHGARGHLQHRIMVPFRWPAADRGGDRACGRALWGGSCDRHAADERGAGTR